MNETIKLLKNHRSIREFDTEKGISECQVQVIMEAAMAAPNWINGQQVSVIEIRDPGKKSMLSKHAGNQKWIEEAPVFFVFCLDFYRAGIAAEKNGKELQIVDNIEALLVGSTDVGIALGNAIAAAESMGLGIVPIGGIRRNPDAFIDELKLPPYVFPVTGLAVGAPRKIPGQKPRLPLDAVYHKEQYNSDRQSELINEYDDMVAKYHTERSDRKRSDNWSGSIASFYDQGFEEYAKKVGPALKKQGFNFS
ncbi:NADPH-dependent oxidoreductase [Mesobacillus foraminis]|uniref:NADPH-dependent oxidoreductase n=1 Tax=Mesobacillus foraminis TaxID=279826 RepID=UPI0039A1CE69